MADVKGYDQLGNPVFIPAEQVASAEQLGYRVATPEDLRLEQVKKEYGSVPNQIGAAVTGALSGATLGLSDVAISELGGREALKAYETLYPGLRTGGEVVGAIAPVLLSGGTGAAAKAATTLGRGAILAEQAGNVAVRALGLAESAEAASGIGRTAARWATQAGVESAIQGVGQETARLAIDNELSGEKVGQIAAKGLLSGVVGGGVGAGLGALGGVVNRAAQAIPPELRGTSLGKRIEEQLYRMNARRVGMTGAEVDAAAELANPEMRAIALDAEKNIRLAVEGEQAVGLRAGPKELKPGSLQADLEEKWANQQVTSQVIRDGSLKGELIRGNIKADADAIMAQRATVNDALAQSLQEVQAARAAGKLEFGQTGLEQLEYELTKAAEAVDRAMAIDTAVESAEALYTAADVIAKRAIGRAASRFERIANPMPADSRVMTEVLEPMYERLRLALEDEGVWGRVGAFQREMNAPMTKAINANDAVVANWYEKIGFNVDPTNPWKRAKVANPEKIVGNIQASTKPGVNFADRALRQQVENEKEWISKALEYGNFENMSALRSAAEKQKVINDRIIKTLDEAQVSQKAKDLLDQLGAANGGLSDMLVGAAIGSGNPVLALLAPLTKPKLVMQGAQVLENIATGQGGAIARAVGKAGRAIARGAVRATQAVPVAGATAYRYADRAKRVEELSTQAPVVRRQLERDTQWMADRAPTARAVAVDTALRQLDYLRRNMPQGLAAPTPFAPKLPPSRQEMSAWLNRLKAIESPTSILDDLAAGKLTPEAVDAVRSVYPETYADIQGKVLEQLASLESKGKRPSYAQRIQLGLVLGIPTDPMLDPATLRAVQGQYQAQPNQVREGAVTPAPGRAPNIAKAFQSGSEELEQR